MKKGIVTPILTIFIFIIIGYVFLTYYSEAQVQLEYQGVLGKRALEIRELALEYKLSKFETEQSAKSFSYGALKDLGLKGGNFEGENIWFGESNANENFIKFFEKEFNFYLDKKKLAMIGEKKEKLRYIIQLESVNSGFKIRLKSKYPIISSLRGRGVDFRKIHEFEIEIPFDLKIYRELYVKYEGSKQCPSDIDCKVVKDTQGKKYLQFNYDSKDLKFVDPDITFRMPIE